MGPDPYSDDTVNIDQSDYMKQHPFGSRHYPMGYRGQDPNTMPPPKIWVALLQSFLIALLVLGLIAFIMIYAATHH